jgi:hypothetical protein
MERLPNLKRELKKSMLRLTCQPRSMKTSDDDVVTMVAAVVDIAVAAVMVTDAAVAATVVETDVVAATDAIETDVGATKLNSTISHSDGHQNLVALHLSFFFTHNYSKS